MRLKVSHYFDITCCICGRSRSSDYAFGMTESVARLRKQAKVEGWKADTETGQPICPECAEKKLRYTDAPIVPSLPDWNSTESVPVTQIFEAHNIREEDA